MVNHRCPSGHIHKNLKTRNRDRFALLTALARLAGLPAEVVVGREHGERRFQVAELFGEAQRQPIEPLHEYPLRAIQPLYVAGGYRVPLPLAYPLMPVRFVPTISDGV